MVLDDILSFFLRICELIFSIIVIALTASWLRHHETTNASLQTFVYTIAMAAVSILYSLVFMMPAWGSAMHWPVDLLLFIANIIAFGLLLGYANRSCGNVWDLKGVLHRTECGKYKSDLSFVFLTAIFFLASAVFGLYIVRKRMRVENSNNQVADDRRRWYSGRG